MTPDIPTRLGTIARALQQVVIPALPSDQVLAIEQATLCLGHLELIAEQYCYSDAYEAACLRDLRALAEELIESAAGGSATTAAAEALGTVLACARPDSGEFVPERWNSVATTIDDLIRASSFDGAEEFLAASHHLVLDHGRRQSLRDRTWFSGCGLDPESETLPGIHELLEPKPK